VVQVGALAGHLQQPLIRCAPHVKGLVVAGHPQPAWMRPIGSHDRDGPFEPADAFVPAEGIQGGADGPGVDLGWCVMDAKLGAQAVVVGDDPVEGNRPLAAWRPERRDVGVRLVVDPVGGGLGPPVGDHIAGLGDQLGRHLPGDIDAEAGSSPGRAVSVCDLQAPAGAAALLEQGEGRAHGRTDLVGRLSDDGTIDATHQPRSPSRPGPASSGTRWTASICQPPRVFCTKVTSTHQAPVAASTS
jgi:hypothetical protein